LLPFKAATTGNRLDTNTTLLIVLRTLSERVGCGRGPDASKGFPKAGLVPSELKLKVANLLAERNGGRGVVAGVVCCPC